MYSDSMVKLHDRRTPTATNLYSETINSNTGKNKEYTLPQFTEQGSGTNFVNTHGTIQKHTPKTIHGCQNKFPHSLAELQFKSAAHCLGGQSSDCCNGDKHPLGQKRQGQTTQNRQQKTARAVTDLS